MSLGKGLTFAAAVAAAGLVVADLADGTASERTEVAGLAATDPSPRAIDRGPEVAAYADRYGITPELARLIHEAAEEAAVEPDLVFGIVATESRFDPRAVGPGGAIGLMQIKPSTARAYEASVTREGLTDPRRNLRLGLRHLKRELEHFDRDWTLGLLAYNMGRTRLERALDRGSTPRNRYPAKVLAHCLADCT